MQQPSRQPDRHYVPQKVHVQIQPSQAYEIKETDSGYETYSESGHQSNEPTNYGPPEAYQHESVQGPVIILRIPGPAKYAAHLQALLQQYLEVRAAQYIKLLHDDEQRNRLAQHMANNRHQQYGYAQSPHGNQGSAEEPRYQSESPSYRSSESPQQQYAYRYETPQQSHNEEVAEYHQSYPEDQQSYQSDDEHPGYIYVKNGDESAAHLSSKENYPSPAHTQVYYPGHHQSIAYAAQESSAEQPAHSSNGYHHAEQQQSPLVYQHHHHQQRYEYVPSTDSDDSEYGQASSDTQNYIAITQKTPGTNTTPPYNYHAHPTASVAAATAAKNGKRQAAFSSVDQYKKFSMLANRLREKSAVMKHIGKDEEKR